MGQREVLTLHAFSVLEWVRLQFSDSEKEKRALIRFYFSFISHFYIGEKRNEKGNKQKKTTKIS